GLLFGVGTGISSTSVLDAAVGEMRPMRLFSLPASSVNQRFPSGPVVIPLGETFAVGIGISSPAPIPPAVVMRAMLLPKYSVNHSRPSGPVVIPRGVLLAVGIGYSVIVPTSAADAGPTTRARAMQAGSGIARSTARHYAQSSSSSSCALHQPNRTVIA